MCPTPYRSPSKQFFNNDSSSSSKKIYIYIYFQIKRERRKIIRAKKEALMRRINKFLFCFNGCVKILRYLSNLSLSLSHSRVLNFGVAKKNPRNNQKRIFCLDMNGENGTRKKNFPTLL